MNAKVFKTLEYDKIITKLSSYATSAPGKLICSMTVPSDDLEVVRRLQNETASASSRIFAHGTPSFAGVTDIRMSIRALGAGSTLNSRELLNIAGLLQTAREAVKYNGETEDVLSERFNLLNPVRELCDEINRCILSEEEISDDASPELKEIRRHKKNTNDRIRNELTGLISGSDRQYLQEAVITTREGRYCIPVKAEYHSKIPGMIHDRSNTGSTFFIEPMSVVRLNNELRELDIRESEEISKILATLSSEAAGHSEELTSDYELLTELDCIFARAGLSHSMRGSEPLMNDNGYINIRRARHPLIDSTRVVPIDISVGRDYNQLIITGPNTGGKTVTLKTVGLFSLMAQSGLHIPASDNSELTVFREIFADIGDEQSIEQSLSTFSSHMKNIITILGEASKDTLVLFDELCAGTDPTEGAALAISILSSLHRKGITTIATTHYSELKIFALSTDGIENASCEFDVATLAPTYRLLIGIPGKSNAFAISGKLGLPEEIIEEARKSIDAGNKAFEDVISELERNRIKIERERAEIELYKKETEELKKQLELKTSALNKRSSDILEKAREEASAILREAKETADDTIRKFNRAREKGMSISDMEAERERIRKQLDKAAASGKKSGNTVRTSSHKAEDFHIGDRVHVISMGLDGTVHTLPDSKGNLTVMMGILSSRVNISDLCIIEEASAAEALKNKNSGIGKLKMSKTAGISSEINLIGMTKDEALTVLDKYLDDAFLAHLSPIRIVHGKGSGVLRNAVQSFLKRQKRIKSFRPGSFGEGDYGVTIAEFKE